jgi:hypothetical protein
MFLNDFLDRLELNSSKVEKWIYDYETTKYPVSVCCNIKVPKNKEAA